MSATTTMKTSSPAATTSADTITLRQPTTGDAATIRQIVVDSGVLDVNALYTYLLWCREFATTSRVAELDGEVIGFVTGFRPETRPDVYFLWQVGVSAAARGRGVAKSLIVDLLRAESALGARYLETTVTPSNTASRALFRSVAKAFDVACVVEPYLTAEDFGAADHEPEELFRIGPLAEKENV